MITGSDAEARSSCDAIAPGHARQDARSGRLFSSLTRSARCLGPCSRASTSGMLRPRSGQTANDKLAMGS
eukprot:2563631-Pleurochrysis_carterae.AAC.3